MKGILISAILFKPFELFIKSTLSIFSIFIFLSCEASAKLKKPADAGTKSSEEIFDFRDILEIYVPIYEARLIGPKKRIKIVRIDAVRKKIL